MRSSLEKHEAYKWEKIDEGLSRTEGGWQAAKGWVNLSGWSVYADSAIPENLIAKSYSRLVRENLVIKKAIRYGMDCIFLLNFLRCKIGNL